MRTRTTKSRFWTIVAVMLMACGTFLPLTWADTIAWNAAGSGDWDTTTTNWTGDVGGRNDMLYVDGDDVSFSDTTGGTINLTANRAPGSTTVDAASGTYTFSGVGSITSGSLLKNGGSTLILNVPYTASGPVNINNAGGAGIFRWGASDLIGDNVSIVGNHPADGPGGAALDMNGFNETIRGINRIVHITNMGNLTYTAGNDTWAGGTISGAGALIFAPSHSFTTWGPKATHTGGTFIQGGVVHLYQGTNTFPITGDVTVDAGATWSLNYHETAATTHTIGGLFGGGEVRSSRNNIVATTFIVGNGDASSTFNGFYSGPGSLTKTGAGTLTLNGNNTYTGTTFVSGGKLVVNGTTGPGQGDYNVLSGATLGGSGTIDLAVAGSVTVQDGATLEPGQSAGTLTINGELILNPNSLIEFELNTPGVIGGGVNDLIEVGDLTLDGTLNINALPGFGNGTYRLMNYSGTLTDNGLDIVGGPTGTYVLSVGMGEVNLLVANVVPEPSSFVLLGLGALGLVGLRRHRRK